jgi:hypothetical protein
MKKTDDINPWLFVVIVLIIVAGALAYVDLKSDVLELQQSVLKQVFG